MWSEDEWIYERRQLYALRQAHPEWSLRGLAREVGHDLGWVRKWTRRFNEGSEQSESLFESHSRRPHSSPRQIGESLKERIAKLREELSERFHRSAGAETIQYYLKKELTQVPCASSIYHILHERGYISSRVHAKGVPLDLPAPMEEWEMDFGEIYLGPVEGILEFFLVVDRGTSLVVYLEGCAGYNAERALDALLHLFEQHGLPKRLRYDRDPRLWGSWTRDSYPSPLTRLLRVLGIEPVVCPPHRPDKKPFVERCIQTLKREWLARYSPQTLADGLALLAPFIPYHNTQRPHQGQACNNRIPEEAYPTLPTLPALPEQVAPNRWLAAAQGRLYRRRINANGSIQVDRYNYYVGQAHAGVTVLAHIDAAQQMLIVTAEGKLFKRFPIKGLYPERMNLLDFVERLKAEARQIEQYRAAHWEQTGDIL